MDEIDRTPASLPNCNCPSGSKVIVTEMFNLRAGRTLTMFRCQECGYTTWDDRPTARAG